MKKLIVIILTIFSATCFAASQTVISTSATPTVINLSTPPSLTVQVTVGSGDTCLVEFSNTPGSGISGGNWQPVAGLSSITANATATLPSPVQALRISRTAGSSTCQMDLAGSF